MFPAILSIHNVLRWLVVIFAVLALVRMYLGWLRKSEWTKADDRTGMLFTMFLDLQALVGLVLYFAVSPITTGMFSGTLPVSHPGVRFFGTEHIALMIVALAVAHVGRSLAKKAPEPTARFRRAALWYTASVILLLVAIPWPFASVSRPWLRLGSFSF